MHFKILGAGPAGLSAAICLAERGYAVDVFEETSVIGGHTGNNIQAIRNYGSDSNILKKIEAKGLKLKNLKPIKKIVKYSPSHRCDEIFSTDEPLFYTFKRGVEEDSIENQLAEQAREIGVNIMLGKKAKIIDCHIIAGGSKFDPVGMGYGAVFENCEFDEKTISFFFGNEFIRHGYAYIVPFGKDQVTIAATSFNRTEFPSIEKKFNEFIAKDKVVKKIVGTATLINRFCGYGHFNVPESAVHKYKYFIGGAAGFVDPARGFGVKYALLSGAMVAEAITRKVTDFDVLWKNEFKQELVDGFNRRVFLNNLKPEDYEQFIKERKISVRNYEKTPNGLKEMLLRANGALKLKEWKKRFCFEDLFGI